MKNPGATAFTRTPSPIFFANSTASHLVRLSTPALALEYPSTRVTADCAVIDEKLTTAPAFVFSKCLQKDRVGMSVPPRLRLRTSAHCAGSMSKTVLSGGTTAPGRLPPAPFTRASTVPHLSRISSRARPHDSPSRTSHFMAMPSKPFSRQYSRASASLSSLRPKNATRAPHEARYRAVPPARTPVAPVTAITFFSMSNKSFIKTSKNLAWFAFARQTRAVRPKSAPRRGRQNPERRGRNESCALSA